MEWNDLAVDVCLIVHSVSLSVWVLICVSHSLAAPSFSPFNITAFILCFINGANILAPNV